MPIELIQNEEHYNKVLMEVKSIKHTLWIATADIKDLHIQSGISVVPFLSVLSDLIRKKVCIRLLYAKKPGINFKRDFNKYSNLKNGVEQLLCPRIHFKMIIFDMKKVYIGSANLTGAGLGMKSKNHRNFETGVLTDEPSLVQSTIEQIDQIWIGEHCKTCKRKTYCPAPIV